MLVTDTDLDDAKIWTNRAVDVVIGRHFSDAEQIYNLSKEVGKIERFVDQQLLNWLSVGEVTVGEIYDADHDNKIDVAGILNTASYIQLNRVKQGEDGTKTQETLAISGSKFNSLYFDTRIEREVQQSPVTDTLKRNMDIIYQEYELNTWNRHASLGE